ncbi:MAG: TetR/AcrR family transcriptional regulator [Candidatus Dormibacteria bacterium]
MREIATITATDEVATVSLGGVDDDGRRSQIVRAAAAVLGRQGYAETSLKDVAREAGVAPGLLHYYFESKEELLLEVVTVTERQMVANWKAVVEAVDDPLERIVTGLDHAEARCAEQPEFFRLLLDLYTVSLSSPALRTRCARLRAHLIDEIEIELRQVLGRLPAYSLVTPRELAGAVLSAIDGIALSSLVVQQATAAPFRALKVLLLSLVVTAYVTAGQDPPIARLGEMLSRHP